MVKRKLINKIIYNIPNCISRYSEDGKDTIEWAQKILKDARDNLNSVQDDDIEFPPIPELETVTETFSTIIYK